MLFKILLFVTPQHLFSPTLLCSRDRIMLDWSWFYLMLISIPAATKYFITLKDNSQDSRA